MGDINPIPQREKHLAYAFNRLKNHLVFFHRHIESTKNLNIRRSHVD